jgi:tRNA pseudouridine38-40 synthase
MSGRNIKLIIEYHGRRYHGWQIQNTGPTVQQVLLDAIEGLTGERPKLRAAGRTDSGVHALGQAANFFTTSSIPGDKFASALTAHLPEDVTIRASSEVSADFDAKRDSKGKRYAYRVYNSPLPSALERHRAWWIRRPLDIERIREAAHAFIGEHDFQSFRSVHCDAAHAWRFIERIDIDTFGLGGAEQGQLVVVTVLGNAFCRHMVRIITGTLMQVGLGRWFPQEMVDMLEARDRRRAGMTAPAQGLYLVEVLY